MLPLVSAPIVRTICRGCGRASASRARGAHRSCDGQGDGIVIGIESVGTNVFPRLLDWPYPNIDRGEGVWLYTTEGREILDACSGGAMVASLGHGLGEIA